MEPVPTVDLRSPSATSLAELDRACQEHGFFLVAGHGVDDLIDRTWATGYRPFPWRELMKGRADDNYRDPGTEDIHISRFRV